MLSRKIQATDQKRISYAGYRSHFLLCKIHIPLYWLKRFFTYLLGIHFLLSGFLPEQSLHELNKIPTLVQHYFHHTRVEKETISFTEFMLMHYGDSEHKKQENHEDLPLYNHTCGCHLFVHEEIITSEPVLSQEKTIQRNHLAGEYFLIQAKGIFQPPKA